MRHLRFATVLVTLVFFGIASVHPQIANFCVARGDWAQPGSLS